MTTDTLLDPNAGPWTDEDHIMMPAFDEALAAALVSTGRPARGWAGHRVIDWGGGRGLYLERFLADGASVVLVEPLATPASPDIRRADEDMTKHVIWIGKAHRVLCLEVMEHIPLPGHLVAFDNVCYSVAPGGFLVFSGATPGQGGHGHVAERPEEEWRWEIERRGLVYMPTLSAGLRQAATLPWFKKNLMVFAQPRPVAP